MIKRIPIVIALISVGTLLGACSPQGQGLAGNKVDGSNCPDSGCVNAAADQNQITISNTGKTTVVRKVQSYNPATPDFIEFGGDCYASTYPFNQIEVKAYYNGGLVGLTAGDIISLHSSSMVPRCVNGRYDFAIRGDRLPAGASGNSYRIEVALVGVDANGAQFRNTGTGLFNVTLQRVP